jgi:hypothetical protein
VTIQQPVTGTITPGTPVAFTATAADNIGVARVVFLVDGQTALTDTTSPYSYSWTAVAGTHSFAAQAFDAAGNSTLSPAISVNVQSPVASGGDVNADGRVNALDLSALISRDGQNYAPADFNGDGTVGAADMAILLSKWTW